ncbi:HlyD family type I secretion periplasmic adaptor subunit [Xanthobacter sediminis]|uniref:HlyD family type I secretion periplasmic adaptor subunit n=1 Tax=Xanthobacter sediminis TaxID=3119926 RepID=UPI00372B5D2F
MIEARAHLSRSLRRNLIAGAIGIVLLFGGIGSWAATTELSGAVIASGILVVDGNAKKIQHLSGGILSDLLVREGQHVDAGDVLIRLDATVTRANLAAITQNLNQLHARHARLAAERDGADTVEVPQSLRSRLSEAEADAGMVSERRLFEDRRSSREGQKARLREQVGQFRQQIIGLEDQEKAKADEIELVELELTGIRPLYRQGIVTLNRLNTLERNAVRLRGERGQLVASIAAARTRISELEVQLLQIDQQMRAEVAAELRDVENDQATLREKEVAALDTLKHIEITAPIAGAVHQLAVHTVGGVVTPAETLMQIVPQIGALTAEARIAPQDIDQLTLGQSATLRLTAFNRNTTPELFGVVVRLSADLEADPQTGAAFYRAAISIPGPEIARLPTGLSLVPGMPVEAFLMTGDRTVASYLLKPLRDHATRAFRAD